MSKPLQLTLANLAYLDDGKGAEAFDLCLRRAVHDCRDRPNDDKPRIVTLPIELVPVVESDLSCTEVTAKIKAAAKVPEYKTKSYSLGIRGKDMLVFSEFSPGDVNQASLDVGDES